MLAGEFGATNELNADARLAWLRTVRTAFEAHGIGWALWNFRGDFGVLDSGRADAAYTDWHDHRLDGALLALLQAS